MSKALVGFSAYRSKSNYCICSACFDTTAVVKIRYPQTRFYDYKTLSTQYREIWFCEDCAKKLVSAIERAEDEE